MQVAIYAAEEKRRRAGFDHVLVLARRGEALILRRDAINALWVLPEGQMTRGQSADEAAEARWARPSARRCSTFTCCAPTA